MPGLISDFYLFIFIAAAVSSALQQPMWPFAIERFPFNVPPVSC